MSTKCLLVIVASLTLGFASDAYASKAVNVGCGQTITADTIESHIAGNTVSDNGGAGVLLDAADTNQVSSNFASQNVDGVVVIGNANTITDNQVTDTGGCKKGCGYGISVEAGASNLIAQNDVRRTLLDGIRIDDFFPELPTVDNVVRDNVVSDAPSTGSRSAPRDPGP
jgi:parallel beta-helix repeat protein